MADQEKMVDYGVQIQRISRVESRLPGAAHSVVVYFTYLEPNPVSAPEVGIKRRTWCVVDITKLLDLASDSHDEAVRMLLSQHLNNYAGMLVAKFRSYTRQYGTLHTYIELHRNDAPTTIKLHDSREASFVLSHTTLDGASPDFNLYVFYQLKHPDRPGEVIGGRMLVADNFVNNLLAGSDWFLALRRVVGEYIVELYRRRALESRAIKFVNDCATHGVCANDFHG